MVQCPGSVIPGDIYCDNSTQMLADTSVCSLVEVFLFLFVTLASVFSVADKHSKQELEPRKVQHRFRYQIGSPEGQVRAQRERMARGASRKVFAYNTL